MKCVSRTLNDFSARNGIIRNAIVIASFLFYITPNNSFAQSIPENASPAPYDIFNDWKCNTGFKRVGDGCEKIVLPKNASLAPYSSTVDWTCNSGFKKSGDGCDEIVLPENASLAPYDIFNDWKCNTGFKRVGDGCIVMTNEERIADELLRAQLQARLERAALERRSRSLASRNCRTEPDTDSEVCVRIIDAEIDCSENYEGTHFDSCEVEIDYVVETDYSGNGSINVDLYCEIEVEYESETTYSGSDDEDFRVNVTIYANDFHSGSEDLDFDFYFEEPKSVELSEAKCRIDDLYR